MEVVVVSANQHLFAQGRCCHRPRPNGNNSGEPVSLILIKSVTNEDNKCH